MYINNEDFEIWMQKLSKKLSEIGQDLKSLINTKEVFDPKKMKYQNRNSYIFCFYFGMVCYASNNSECILDYEVYLINR